MKFLEVFVILCLATASSMATEKDTVSPATLEHMKLIEQSIATSLTTCEEEDPDCSVSTAPSIPIEPCDDFYSYACGHWGDLPFTQGENKSNHIIQKKNFHHELTEFLYTKYADDINQNNQTFEQKVLNFYYFCFHGGLFNLYGILKPGSNIEWPLFDEFLQKPETDVTHFDLFTFLGQVFSYGFDNILLSRIVRRESNGSLYIELDLPSVSELDEEATKSMLNNINEYIEDRPAEEDIQKYLKHIQETSEEFNSDINDKFSSGSSETFSFAQIKQLYPQWAKFLNAMLPNQMGDDDVIVFSNMMYLEYLEKKEWQPQETRELLNYIMALLEEMASPNKYHECDQKVYSQMHLGVNYLYRKYFYTAEIQTDFEDLNEKIKNSLLELVDENPSLFADSEVQAIKERISSIHVSVGNVPDSADDAMLEEFYRHFPDEHGYGEIYLASMKQRFWETLNCPADMDCSEGTDYDTYSITDKGLIVVPFSVLIPTFYHYTYDPIFAFSLLGSKLAAEYAYHIDANALVEEPVKGSVSEDFENHARLQEFQECTEKQFDTEYKRQLTDDLIGARVAFHAYNKAYKTQPSFTDISWQQLFFLNFAQDFCEWRDWSGEQREHIVRPNYVAMNMQEFAEAFKCPADSKLNPEKKCLLY